MNTNNKAQLQAISSNNPRIVCLAGPGSGKTRTITERIKRLIRDATVSVIVAITYTNAATLTVQADHLKLVWDANPESQQVTQYNVYQFDNSETNRIGTALTNEFILEDLEPGKTSFYVTAENLWGESEPSNTVTTPQDLPGPPGQLRFDADL